MIALNDYKDKNIHFIAIGGHSMCGLAEILHNWGFGHISGSDRADSDAVRRLAGMGIQISVGHSVENVKQIAKGLHGAGYCTACLNGDYPTEIPETTSKNRFESKISAQAAREER